MKILKLDLVMGAAGDMLTAALLELFPEDQKDKVIAELNAIGVPGVTVGAERVVRCGIAGTHMSVKVNGEEEESVDGHGHHEHHHEFEDEIHHEHHHHEFGDEVHHEHHHHEFEDEVHHEHHHHEFEDEIDHEHHHHDHDEHEHHHEHDHGHDHDHHHHYVHVSMEEIRGIVAGLNVPEEVKADVIAVYEEIAKAESRAHGKEVSEVHFHEVGMMDAIADIAAVCLLMHKLKPDRVIATPVHVGSGMVRCAHGLMPVPAPATAYLLEGIPYYEGRIRGELCTPTGAALLRHFVDTFAGENTPITVERVGYGCGKKDFPEAANCVRAILGEGEKAKAGNAVSGEMKNDKEGSEEPGYEVIGLSCNVDDMTGEEMGFAIEELLRQGAREAFATPVIMKKGRPGLLLTVLCDPEKKDHLVRQIFKNTTTIGIRETGYHRYMLDRRIETRQTPLGEVRYKVSEGYGVRREKPEHEDVARVAREHGMSLLEVKCKTET